MVIFILNFDLKRSKNLPKVSRDPYENNKFCILDETKYNPEKFVILHSIIPK
jgi:hypothetical protein